MPDRTFDTGSVCTHHKIVKGTMLCSPLKHATHISRRMKAMKMKTFHGTLLVIAYVLISLYLTLTSNFLLPRKVSPDLTLMCTKVAREKQYFFSLLIATGDSNSFFDDWRMTRSFISEPDFVETTYNSGAILQENDSSVTSRIVIPPRHWGG